MSTEPTWSRVFTVRGRHFYLEIRPDQPYPIVTFQSGDGWHVRRFDDGQLRLKRSANAGAVWARDFTQEFLNELESIFPQDTHFLPPDPAPPKSGRFTRVKRCPLREP
jgi:hypothetical protein